MILVTNEQCIAVCREIRENPEEFSDFELEFADSNEYRQVFTTAQKDVITNFCKKYQFNCMP